MKSITRQMRGGVKTAYGYIWNYDPPNIPKIKADSNEKFDSIKGITKYDLSNYSISRKGHIKHNRTNYLLATRIDQYGYVLVSLCCKDKKNPLDFRLHRLLAFTYLKNNNPNIKTEIDHIDKNRQNNDLSNLEWVTHGNNMMRASGKMVKMIDIETNKVLIIFNCVGNAFRYLGLSCSGNISRVCNGKLLTAGGYKWEYVGEEEKYLYQ